MRQRGDIKGFKCCLKDGGTKRSAAQRSFLSSSTGLFFTPDIAKSLAKAGRKLERSPCAFAGL